MTEMSVALCPFSMVDRHGRSPGDPCWGHLGVLGMEGGALRWEPPLQVSLGRQLVLSLSEPRGQRGGGGELGPRSQVRSGP